MNAHKQGWFTEIGAPRGSSVDLSILSKKTWHQGQLEFRDTIVFESDTSGACLALDNVVQCKEMNEFSYQEMTAFISINSHIRPPRLGGGVARECLKHPLVECLVQCEIDGRVVDLSKKFFPSMAASYCNPKLELIIGDGYKHISELPGESFHVTTTDSSDLKGPAEFSPQKPCYELSEKILTKNGVICRQVESIWFDLEFVSNLLEINRKVFKKVSYASTMTCVYPGGQIGFSFCCNG